MTKYGIFRNMEYSEIWNIFQNGIFLSMECLENGKVKRSILF